MGERREASQAPVMNTFNKDKSSRAEGSPEGRTVSSQQLASCKHHITTLSSMTSSRTHQPQAPLSAPLSCSTAVVPQSASPPASLRAPRSYQLLFPQPGVDRKFVWGGACMSFQREPRHMTAKVTGSAAMLGYWL